MDSDIFPLNLAEKKGRQLQLPTTRGGLIVELGMGDAIKLNDGLNDIYIHFYRVKLNSRKHHIGFRFICDENVDIRRVKACDFYQKFANEEKKDD